MEGSWLRSRKKKKSRRAATAARLRRAVQQSQQARTSGKDRRRRAAATSCGRGTAVARKFRELQALVPGGEGLRADQLFLRTAGYILHLRLQVHLLRVLSGL
ncbi:hypothetical protein Taro_051138 [Colocasia esculenta]|uniref:Uncharacterized protein n=1 Tax=Colocasia esculenta TaxID=4460 RepID=A0A843XFY4_COLES|nr:hypothetical protein [Colocasia esculenta]